jgi:hypothetical protein
MVSDLDETEVAKELATSLAPVRHELRFDDKGDEREEGTDVPGVENGEYGGDDKDVVVLMEYGHCVTAYTNK